MYISDGHVEIVNSIFADNHADGGGNDIYAAPAVTIINSTFQSEPNAIHGNAQACKPLLCQDAIPSYPKYGIDCETNKGTKYGVQCYRCHPGKFLNDTYASCLPCLPGTFTSNYGSASCSNCSPGKVAPKKGATGCKLCEQGKYSNNAITCIDVPPGMYPSNCSDALNKKGCSSITPCPRGFSCASKTTKPIQCLQGYYSNITGAPMCLKCNSGRASNIVQATECKECEIGQFATKEGMKTCRTCTNGRTTYNKGSITCSDCTIGKAGINGTCSPCKTGKYQDESGATNCKKCPSGKQSAKTTCTPCNAGKYLDGWSCKPCTSGTYSSAGASSCKTCPKGTWTKLDVAINATFNSSSGCFNCPAGFYGVMAAQTMQINACKACKKGTFSSAIAAGSITFCNDCPLGTASNVLGANSSSACKLCAKGTAANKTGMTKCDRCPLGSWATGGKEGKAGRGSTLCRQCGLGQFLNGDACQLCPSGKYQDTPGQVKCKNCTTGHSIQTRTTCTTCHAGGYFDGYDCVACPTGYYSLAGDKSCTICTIGQYAKLDKDGKTFYNVTTSSGCFSCRPGLYGVAKGKVSETDACAKCGKGRFGTASGATSIELCNKCPLGKASAIVGANTSGVCKQCKVGKVANATGLETCYACKIGSIPSKGATQCQACSKGTYQRKNECISCSEGKSQNKTGTNACNTCLAGKYSSFKGLPTCLQCSPGQAVDSSNNNTKCLLCKIGTFASSPGSVKCVTCEAGMTTFVKGSVQCSNCPKGKVGRNGVCEVCAPGRHAPRDGSKVCTPCEVGKQTDSNNISCVKMGVHGSPPRSISIKMGPNRTTLVVKWKLPREVIGRPEDRVVIVPVDRVTNDDVYQSVWYGPARALNATLQNLDVYKTVYTLKISIHHEKDGSTSPNQTYSKRWSTVNDCNTDDKYLNASSRDLSDWKCNPCPRGASCQGPVRWNGVKARFGNWHVPRTTKFAKCIRPESCLGAANNLYYDRFPKLAHNNSISVSCAASPYIIGNPFVQSKDNRLCARCNRPFYARGSSKGSCVKCHKIWNLIILTSSIVFGLAGFTILLRMTLSKRKDIKLSDGIKKIAINYLQFASLALHLDMPWTKVLQELFKWQSYGIGVSNALLSLDCILADTYATWKVFQIKFFGTLLLPVIFIPIAYVIVKGVLHGGWNEFVGSLILFWYLMYPQIVKSVTTLFSCTYVIDGSKYLIIDPDVKCYEYGISVWVGVVFSFVVYVVGMPAVSFLAVKRLDRSMPASRLKFGILYDGYDSKNYWWWEIVIQVRKLSVILISAFVESRVQQILLVLFVIVVSLFFTAWLRPFYDDRLVRMEMVSLIVCFLTFFFGSMFLSDEQCVEDKEVLCVVGQWVVILINIGCVLALGINYSQSWFAEKGDLIKKYCRLCKACLCCCTEAKGSRGLIQHRQSFVEMNVEDLGTVGSGIGNVTVDSDEYHRL